LQTAWVLQVDRDGFLIGVEVQEVRIVLARLAAERAARIAAFGVFDLHHFGAKPSEGFGAGWPSLELGHVQDTHAGEAVAPEAVCGAEPVGCHERFPYPGRPAGTLGRIIRKGKPLGLGSSHLSPGQAPCGSFV
jgi:hypothetical protein